MSIKQCCKTCKYCGDQQGQACSWCRLRQLSVHPELAACVVCHHWTKREPLLPNVEDTLTTNSIDKQLEIEKTLDNSINTEFSLVDL